MDLDRIDALMKGIYLRASSHKIVALLLVSVFLVSATVGLFNIDTYVTKIRSVPIFNQFQGMPMILAVAALLIKIGGSLMMLSGVYPHLGVTVLSLFTILVTYLYHNPLIDPSQLNNMLKNGSVLAGLILWGGVNAQ